MYVCMYVCMFACMFVRMYVCMYIRMYNVFKTADLALYVAMDAPGRVVPGDMTWQFAMPQCSSTSHQCDTVGEEGRGTHNHHEPL